jgi:hypothetical protein
MPGKAEPGAKQSRRRRALGRGLFSMRAHCWTSANLNGGKLYRVLCMKSKSKVVFACASIGHTIRL